MAKEINIVKIIKDHLVKFASRYSELSQEQRRDVDLSAEKIIGWRSNEEERQELSQFYERIKNPKNLEDYLKQREQKPL